MAPEKRPENPKATLLNCPNHDVTSMEATDGRGSICSCSLQQSRCRVPQITHLTLPLPLLISFNHWIEDQYFCFIYDVITVQYQFFNIVASQEIYVFPYFFHVSVWCFCLFKKRTLIELFVKLANHVVRTQNISTEEQVFFSYLCPLWRQNPVSIIYVSK